MGVAIAGGLRSPSLSQKGRVWSKKDGGTKPKWNSCPARDASDAGLGAGMRNYLAGRSRFLCVIAIVRGLAVLDRWQCYMQRRDTPLIYLLLGAMVS